MRKALVIGCGLTGAVIARKLAEKNYNVTIWERRNHIGGNMYDFLDEYGIRLHKYGPHTFHTYKKELFDFMCKYAEWEEYHLICGAEINGIITSSPFNFKTVDDFYPDKEADSIKRAFLKEFPEKETITVVEALENKNKKIREYAQFLFDNDYSLYTAKQWGITPEQIDSSVLKRVPLRLSYKNGYFDDPYQVMPCTGYTAFFEKLLAHPNIQIELEMEALKRLEVTENGLGIMLDGQTIDFPIIYTGALDELFGHRLGVLPYRSVKFEWIHEDIESKQPVTLVAYPQAEGFTRIVEYKKFQNTEGLGTTYGKEYPIPYNSKSDIEPYYPILTKKSRELYEKYSHMVEKIRNLFACGRLGDFQYYNMDQALERALQLVEQIK